MILVLPLGLPRIRKTVSISPPMPINFLDTPFTLTFSVLLVIAAAVLSWLGWRRSGYNWKVGLLEFLRTLIVAMVAITFNQPEWLTTFQPANRPTLLVLADESKSMETLDVVDSAGAVATRADFIQPLLEDSVWEEVGESMDIVVEKFSSQLDVPTAGTDVAAPLTSALKKHENLRGVVLISDGDWNVGDPPASIAGRLRLNKSPVYTLVAGSESKLPDLVLDRFDAPSYGVVSKPMRLPFVVTSSLPRDIQTTVTLEVSSGEKISRDILIPAMGTVEDSLLWKPMRVGEEKLIVSLPTQQDELVEENNSRIVPITIKEEAIKVLLIESFPRWEYRYLRNALERDPGVDANCLLFHPGLSKVGGGKGYISIFPATLKELKDYDVVFLGDVGVGEGQLTVEQCRLLKGLIRSQASGLILMPGMRGGHLSLGSTELDELYPVVLDPAQKRGWGSRDPAQFELTETGRQSLLTKLEDDEAENARLWETLPGFHWYAAAKRSKAGTEVLATHKTEIGPQGRIPLLVTKTYGTGKVLYMGTDAAWRWREGVEDKYHYRFWGQVARWMAYQRGIAPGEKMRLFYSPDSPLTDTVVTLNANVMSVDGEPLQNGTVTLQAISPSGDSETIRLRASDDEWGLFTGSFNPKQRGDYKMVLSCRENNATLETKLSVQGLDRERIGQPARADVMDEIARVSGGRSVKATELADLITEIQSLPEPEPLTRRLRIWANPFWAGSIVLLLGIFWSGRKMVGQV